MQLSNPKLQFSSITPKIAAAAAAVGYYCCCDCYGYGNCCWSCVDLQHVEKEEKERGFHVAASHCSCCCYQPLLVVAVSRVGEEEDHDVEDGGVDFLLLSPVMLLLICCCYASCCQHCAGRRAGREWGQGRGRRESEEREEKEKNGRRRIRNEENLGFQLVFATCQKSPIKGVSECSDALYTQARIISFWLKLAPLRNHLWRSFRIKTIPTRPNTIDKCPRAAETTVILIENSFGTLQFD